MGNRKEKINLPIVKIKDLPESFIFKNCTIGSKDIDTDYGQSYMLFFENNGVEKISFVNTDTNFGKQLSEHFDKIVNTVFEMEIKEFGNGQYRGFSIVKITKLRDLVVPSQTKLEGF